MIIIKRSTNNQYFFIVRAKNGKTLVTSETYKRKENAEKGITFLTNIFVNDPWVKDQTSKPVKYPRKIQ